MWETRPYVAEISLEFRPLLDFLTSDNRGVGARMDRPPARDTQSISTFTIVFLETSKGDNKILIKPKHWTEDLGEATRSNAQTTPYTD